MRSYKVKHVAELLGVSTHTLRAWERRYRAITPQRNSVGRRVYSVNEIKRLKLLVELTRRAHSISTIAPLSNAELSGLLQQDAGSADVFIETSLEREIAEPVTSLTESVVSTCLVAVDKFQTIKLSQDLERAIVTFGARPFILDVMWPLLLEMGKRTAAGTMSAAKEQACAAVLRHHVGYLLQWLQQRMRKSTEATSPAIVLATPSGFYFEFGILGAAVLCGNRGLTTHYLGSGSEAETIVDAVRETEASVVILGTRKYPTTEVGGGREFLAELDKRLPPAVEVWVSGKEGDQPFEGNRETRFLPTLADLDRQLEMYGDLQMV